jgi:hypothetical protein
VCVSPSVRDSEFSEADAKFVRRGSKLTMRDRAFFTAIVAILTIWAVPGDASLIGTTVDAQMYFGSQSSANCFSIKAIPDCDAVNGSGTTAVIGSASPLFEWPGFDFDTLVNFSSSGLEISFDPDAIGATFNSIHFRFDDPAFSGLTLSLLSTAEFTNSSQYSWSLSGDTISVDTISGLPVQNGAYDFVFALDAASTPEPSTMFPLVSGLVLCGLTVMCRQDSLS